MTDPFTPPSGEQPPQPPPHDAPPYGAPGYGAPYGSPQGAPVGKRNGFGVAALVLGILSLVTFFFPFVGVVLGVLAIVFAVLGRRRVSRREADNGGLAIAGLVTGIIGLLLNLFVTAAYLFFADTFRCVQEAQDDPVARAQCENELRNRLT